MNIERLDNGGSVHQVTDDEQLKDNIYCERSYCTPDARWFVFQRQVSTRGPTGWHFTAEYIACEFGTWQTRVLGIGHSYPEISPRGGLYFARPGTDVERELVRVDMATGQSRAIPVNGGVRPYTGMTISADERYLAYGVALSFEPQMFGVEFVDLETGERRIICEDPFISNPHTQIDPGDAHRVLVQQNRGCRFKSDGTVVTWLGEQGCTLFTVDAHNGAIAPLQVGPPHTPSCTGHQQWIADTHEVLLTVNSDPYRPGNLLTVCAGAPARPVCEDDGFAHVHASVCGQLFCADRIRAGEIVVGAIATGRRAVICPCGPQTREIMAQYGQSAHAHAYLSPDARWVVFNSCRTGRPEIHAASIPHDLRCRLLDEAH